MHTLLGQSHHFHYFIHQWNDDQCQIFIFSFNCCSLLTTFSPHHQPPPPSLTMLRGFFIASLLAPPSSCPNQRLKESCEISHFPKSSMSRQSANLALKYFFKSVFLALSLISVMSCRPLASLSWCSVICSQSPLFCLASLQFSLYNVERILYKTTSFKFLL